MVHKRDGPLDCLEEDDNCHLVSHESVEQTWPNYP